MLKSTCDLADIYFKPKIFNEIKVNKKVPNLFCFLLIHAICIIYIMRAPPPPSSQPTPKCLHVKVRAS